MKEQFFAKLDELVAAAKHFLGAGFGEVDPEEATRDKLIDPLLDSLGFTNANRDKNFHILGDKVDYLLKHGRPLMFLEAKSLLDPAQHLYETHKQQVTDYIRNYRVSPKQAEMEQPVTWIVLTNFKEFHFIRVTEESPSFSFTLDELIARREELWELLALENVEANRIDELYDQQQKADLDRRFLADLKRWRLIIANGFAIRNSNISLPDFTKASQQLLDRFIFCRMLETNRLIEYDRLARAFAHYLELYPPPATKPFSEVLKESLFAEIKRDFNTELFIRPQLCDELAIDNLALAVVIGHEPLTPDVAGQCGIEQGQGELLPYKHLYQYDFSRMSSDIMGAVYERFLAHKLAAKNGRITIEDTDELRKKEGIYYTPRYIVDYIVEHTVGEKIKPILNEAVALLGYKNYKGAVAKIRELQHVKVLDAAMGSGSFLLRAFGKFVDAYAAYNAACAKHKQERGQSTGMLFDSPQEIPEAVDHLGIRVASENIFGVDLDEQAVEVAKLNLWIRLMTAERDFIRETLRVRTNGKRPLNLLPTLANNLKRGNSLIPDAAVAGDAAFDWEREFPEIMGSARDLQNEKRSACVSRAESGVSPDSSTSKISAPGKPKERSFRRDAENSAPEARAPQSNRGFDCVIGNPPYERIQTMTASAPHLVEFLKANYQSAGSGNFDIYVCFIERGLGLLAPNGNFGYIVPHKFFQAEYGEGLRKLLSDGKHVRKIVSFGDQQIFPQVSTYTCLLFLDKAGCGECEYVKVNDLDAWRDSRLGAAATIPTASFSLVKWNFAIGDAGPLLAKLSKMPVKLKDVAERMSQGIRTSANEVYVLDLRSTDGNLVTAYSEQLKREVKLERKAVSLFLQGREIKRYRILPSGKVVLMPYRIKAGNAELIPERQFQERFPKAYEYLCENKRYLEERERGSFRGSNWYAFGRLQNVDLMLMPKILVPDIADRASYAFDKDGDFAFTSGYGITLKDGVAESPEYILGLLNSKLLDFYLKSVSTTMRGGFFRYFTQFIEQLPIKRVDPKAKREAALAKEVAKHVETIQAAHKQHEQLPMVLQKKVAHSNRTPCTLAHYLQKDYAAAVTAEILIDDVQRKGFVHEIQVASDKNQITVSARVSDDAKGEPRAQPIVRLAFSNEPLQHFVYAMWRRFLDENSRKKKWTPGKTPQPIYQLIVNTLEPLVFFQPAAADNLKAIRDLMKDVAKEAGTADLAAVESNIATTDEQINQLVYELYGLTEAEIKVVEGAAQ